MNGQDPFVPTLSQQEYLKRLKAAGYKGKQALGIMVDAGFNSESVKADLLAEYEREREEFLKEQERLRKEREAELRRREQLEKEREERDAFYDDQKKKGLPSESSGAVVRSGFNETTADPANFERAQQLGALQDEYEIDDPTSPVSTSAPDVLRNAMRRGDSNSVAISESMKNDQRVANLREVGELTGAYQRALRSEDFDAAEEIREDMANLGFEIPEYASGAFTVEDHLKDMRQKFKNSKSEAIEERNLINAQLGLPSSFNPESQVDFEYLLDEAYDRNDFNWKNSELGRYYAKIDKQAEKVKEKYDIVYGGLDTIENIPYLGSAWRLAADIFKGRTQDFMFGLIEGGIGLTEMANEAGMRADEAIFGKSARGGAVDNFIGDLAAGVRVAGDILNRANQLELKSRGVAEADLNSGISESTKALFRGDMDFDTWLSKTSQFTGQTIGQAAGYMRMVGLTKSNLVKAKDAVKELGLKEAAMQGAKGLKPGALVTSSDAAARRTADLALRSARVKHGLNMGVLGGTSGGSFYNSLSGRTDMTFAEKATMSMMIGTAEAFLSDFFSAADVAFTTGRKALVQQNINAIKQQAKQRLAEMTKRQGMMQGIKVATKQGGGEFLEEFTIGLLQEALPYLDDVAFGRTPKDINFYNILDAGIAGLLGAGPTSVMSGFASFQAHNSVLKERNNIRKQMSENAERLSQESDPTMRENIENEQKVLAARLMEVDDASMRAFEKMSEGQRRRMLKIHRDMAYTEARLMDPDLTKEEREMLENRYEVLFRAKKRIEDEAGSEPEFTRNDPPVKAEDAEGRETEVKSESVKALERNNAQLPSEEQETSEAAPEGQREEAEQLSLFDEREANEKAPERKLTEEGKREEAEHERLEKIISGKPEGKSDQDTQDDASIEDIKLGEGELIDITDVEKVGEGEGKISLRTAIRANRLNTSLGKKLAKDGYKFRVYSRAEFTRRYGDKGFGAVDHDNKIISISNDANAAEVTEEFVHAAFRDVIGKDAKGRRAIYNHLLTQAKGSGQLANIIRQEIAFARNNEVYKKQGEAAIQEEAIMGVLLKYVENPEIFEAKPKFLDKFRNLVSQMVTRFSGTKEVAIDNNEKFLEFARRVKESTQGREVDTSQQVDIQERTAEDIQADTTLSQEEKNKQLEDLATSMMGDAEGITTSQDDVLSQDDNQDISNTRLSFGRRKSEFTYLKDTEVFYTEDPFAAIGDPAPQFERTRLKKIKVNDYFHFRNWYNHMTSNGRRPARITKMYFMKDGKKYSIKPPKPKTDRDGNVVRINGAENASITYAKRYWQKKSDEAREVNKRRDAIFKLAEDTDILKRAGIDNVSGMALVPGFNMQEYSQIEDRNERYSYMSEFRDNVLFDRTPEEQAEVLEIAYENLELLKNSGMSAEEVAAADQATLLNMSGRTPSFLAQGGDQLNSGNVRLSSGRRGSRTMSEEQTESWKNSLREAFPGVPDSELFMTDEELKEMDGAQSILIGYDRSGSQTNTGILNQAKQMINGLVVSSHRNKAMRDRVVRKMRVLIEKDRKSKNPKGYIVVALGALDIPSLPGNPQVFSKIVMDHVMEVEGEERIQRINDILKSLSQDDLKGLYKASRERDGAISKRFSINNIDPVRLKGGIEGEMEAEDFMEIIKDVRGFDQFATSFNSRANIGRRIIKDFVLGASGKGSGMRVDEYIQEKFSDLSLKNVPGASVVSVMKVPYEGEGAIDFAPSDSDAFPDAIVSRTASKMKFLAKPIPVEKAYAKATYKDTDKKSPTFGKTLKVFTKKAEKDNKTLKYAKKRLGYGTEAPIHLDDDTVTNHSLSYGRRGSESFVQREESGFEKWKNKWIRRLQDKYVDIFNLQADIERQKGPLRKSQDFKMAEELMYGKAAEDLAKLDKRVESITKLMKKAGVKVDEVSEYLYALHAKERNAMILQRSNGAVKDGSGLSDAEADAIINAANKAALDPIVNEIREIQKDTRETMVKFGLESRETVNAFENMFDNYVPLAGLSLDEQLKSPYPTGGAGMNVFGPTTKRATGRKSKAENILAQIVAQNASVHIKARTNEALQSLHNLVKENPNPKVWRILDEKAGVDSTIPNVVAVRIGGKQKFIYFNDPSYAYNLKGMGVPQSNAFVRALRKPAQWLRASFTTLNPEFFISNFSRDIQAAVFNAAAEADIEGGMLNSQATITRMLKLVPKTLKTLVKDSVQKSGDPAISKYFEEFKEDGGKTGWAFAKPLDQIASELEGATNEKTRTQEILGKAKNFTDTVEGINDAFENSIRLAAYIAARESGVSREKAAQMAKNITVNFNKQGEWGPTLNAVYLFFNASIQGTARLGRSLATLKPPVRPDGTKRSGVERVNTAQWMAGGLALFSSMLTALGYAMSDEDEDGIPYWDKIPDYVKERNLIIMRPNGKDYFKIPMPYGFNVFANMGTAMTESAYGGREADEAMMFLFNSFMASFSPVSFGQSKDLMTSIGKGAVPTVLKPWAEVALNETYFGSPVTGENLPFGVQKPESELSFRSPEMVKDFFQWMNEATGGSEYKSGGLDFNPDKIWYMFEYYIGSAGQFLNRSVKVPRKILSKFASGEDIEIDPNEIPLARILYGEPSKYFDMEKFKDNQQEFESLYKELKEGAVFNRDRHKGIGKNTSDKLRSTLKELKYLRKMKREARELPYAKRTARIQKLRNEERKVIMRFNKYYEQVRGKEN